MNFECQYCGFKIDKKLPSMKLMIGQSMLRTFSGEPKWFYAMHWRSKDQCHALYSTVVSDLIASYLLQGIEENKKWKEKDDAERT